MQRPKRLPPMSDATKIVVGTILITAVITLALMAQNLA